MVADEAAADGMMVAFCSSCSASWRNRSSWRRFRDRRSVRSLSSALFVDESRLMLSVDTALTVVDATAAKQITQHGVPREEAFNLGRKEFARATRQVCIDALEERDLRLARAAWHAGVDGLCALQSVGECFPVTMRPRELPLATALAQFVGALDYTREMRAHDLAERLAREVSIQRGRSATSQMPSELAMPAAMAGLLTAADVARLCAGGAVVVDPGWLNTEEMQTAESELCAHVRTSGLESVSSCNTRAVTTDLPLSGGGYALSPPTKRLLSLLAAVPAAIEALGWPRALRMPPLLQLASYSAHTRARYSPHFDNNPWERHNFREITILLYVNTGWDAARMGGCLRVHAPEGGGLHEDIEPLAGRLVLFHSRLVRHEVLPCTEGVRTALTLWVEHAPDG